MAKKVQALLTLKSKELLFIIRNIVFQRLQQSPKRTRSLFRMVKLALCFRVEEKAVAKVTLEIELSLIQTIIVESIYV